MYATKANKKNNWASYIKEKFVYSQYQNFSKIILITDKGRPTYLLNKNL